VWCHHDRCKARSLTRCTYFIHNSSSKRVGTGLPFCKAWHMAHPRTGVLGSLGSEAGCRQALQASAAPARIGAAFGQAGTTSVRGAVEKTTDGGPAFANMQSAWHEHGHVRWPAAGLPGGEGDGAVGRQAGWVRNCKLWAVRLMLIPSSCVAQLSHGLRLSADNAGRICGQPLDTVAPQQSSKRPRALRGAQVRHA